MTEAGEPTISKPAENDAPETSWLGNSSNPSSVARDMVLVAEYERVHSKRSVTPAKSDVSGSPPVTPGEVDRFCTAPPTEGTAPPPVKPMEGQFNTPEYTVPGAYFSLLNSPALHGTDEHSQALQQQQGKPKLVQIRSAHQEEIRDRQNRPVEARQDSDTTGPPLLSASSTEGPEREDPITHTTSNVLPLGPVAGLNETRHRHSGSFHSDMSYQMRRFLVEQEEAQYPAPYATENDHAESRFLPQDLYEAPGKKRKGKLRYRSASTSSGDASFLSWDVGRVPGIVAWIDTEGSVYTRGSYSLYVDGALDVNGGSILSSKSRAGEIQYEDRLEHTGAPLHKSFKERAKDGQEQIPSPRHSIDLSEMASHEQLELWWRAFMELQKEIPETQLHKVWVDAHLKTDARGDIIAHAAINDLIISLEKTKIDRLKGAGTPMLVSIQQILDIAKVVQSTLDFKTGGFIRTCLSSFLRASLKYLPSDTLTLY
jgi:hypothetical protein